MKKLWQNSSIFFFLSNRLCLVLYWGKAYNYVNRYITTRYICIHISIFPSLYFIEEADDMQAKFLVVAWSRANIKSMQTTVVVSSLTSERLVVFIRGTMSIPWPSPTVRGNQGTLTPMPIESPCLRKVISWINFFLNITILHFFYKSTKIITIFRLLHAEDSGDFLATVQTSSLYISSQGGSHCPGPILSFLALRRCWGG